VTDEIERTELHHRQIDIRFFRRSDGLYEVEGRLLDRKSQAFRRPLQDSETPAGTPLHDIAVRLVVDENSLVHDASASYSASCTHIVELLGPMASTVHQGFAPKRVARMGEPGNEEHNSKVDSCYSYGRDREVVARIWPHLTTRKEAAKT